ncbi:MAG: hypothetical protein ACRCZE_01590 [Candidatus Altimarinota bacterium]
MAENQIPPEDEQTRLIRENKWSYELVTLVLVVLAVAVYFILTGGIGEGGNTDLENSNSNNTETTQQIIPPNNGGVSSGNLD